MARPRTPQPQLVSRSARIRIEHDTLRLPPNIGVTFHRTLRLPDDGGTYPLPPGLGEFPIRRVRDFARRVPAAWRAAGGVFIPLYQREALWLGFAGARWRPNALKLAVGGVNAVSGGAWDLRLRRRPQDYLVIPEQPWLDGINAGAGVVRQFVAMPLGQGYTVEAQVTGKEELGGLQLAVYQPRPGRFPDRPPRRRWRDADGTSGSATIMACCEPAPMGLAAGGRMAQSIYPDPHGVDTWDPASVRTVHVHVVNSAMYRFITGEAPPPSPVSARTYTECGLPWFRLYDEHLGDLPPSAVLAGVKSVAGLDAERAGGAAHPVPAQDDAPLLVPPGQVMALAPGVPA